MIKRLLMVGMFALIGLLGASCTTHHQTHKKDTINIGVRSDVPLVAYYDMSANRVGTEISLAKALAQSLGKKPVLVTLGSKDRGKALLAGKVDMIIATYSITKKRSEKVRFSVPYHIDHLGVMVDAEAHISNVGELSGKRIGVILGANSKAKLASSVPSVKYVYFDNYYRAIISLSLGDIDGIATDKSILNGLKVLWNTKKKKLVEIDGEMTFLVDVDSEIKPAFRAFKILNENLSNEKYAAAVRPSDSLLMKKINAYIKSRK